MEKVDWNVHLWLDRYHLFSSFSAWRKWIEILFVEIIRRREVVFLRMEKVDWNRSALIFILMLRRLSPHGESGLKYQISMRPRLRRTSFSAWRKWIEMCYDIFNNRKGGVFLRMEKVDWNEFLATSVGKIIVFLRMEKVDWNKSENGPEADFIVFLRMEKVDWNTHRKTCSASLLVFLRMEKVDWNFKGIFCHH